MGYKSAAQRKAVHANKEDGGKGHPDNNKGPSKKKGDIKIDPKNEGNFTKWVEKNMPGKDSCGAAKSVMKNKKKYTTRVVKMANFAKNFACKK